MDTTSYVEGNTKILRPFLTESKENLIFVTKIFKIYIKDPSNNNKKFLRSNIRKLLPLLKNMVLVKIKLLNQLIILNPQAKLSIFTFKMF